MDISLLLVHLADIPYCFVTDIDLTYSTIPFLLTIMFLPGKMDGVLMVIPGILRYKNNKKNQILPPAA